MSEQPGWMTSAYLAEALRQLLWLMPLHIAQGLAGFFFFDAFLSRRYGRWKSLLLWVIAMYFGEAVVFVCIDNENALYTVVLTLMRLVLLVSLSAVLYFRREWGMHAFLISTFLAVAFLLRHMLAIFNIYSSELLWEYMMPWIVNHDLLPRMLQSKQMIRGLVNLEQAGICLAGGGILCAYLYLLARAYRDKGHRLSGQDTWFLCLPAMTTVGVAMMLRTVVLMDYQRNYVFLYSENATLRLWILLICVLLLMTMYTSVVLFGQQLVRYEEAQKRRLLETQVDAMRHEIAELKDIYGDIRGLRHDLSNHIEGLLAIVGEKTAATEYLRRMQGTVDRLSPRFRTGDPIIDMLLSRQALAAERAGIRFEADVFVPPSGKPFLYHK